ncbi:MAG: YfcE family phosphodiesterase [Planctomycetaceae bacterium]|jgi:putative phosphoesterase|nr:YfcE family phosphodiesterase [Planctomycetaceae bacterium]MBP62079.1 YfcE family phosphodiesterase [Planctomycetaceae bacterium]
MLIGVVSDTHGHVPSAMKAVRILEPLGVEQIIHCGDIGSARIPSVFSKWPTHYVLGNVDRDTKQLNDAIQSAGAVLHGRFGKLEIRGRRLSFIHGDDTHLLQAESTSGKWHLLCHGHTHVAQQTFVGSTLVLNPGALYRARQHTVAVVEFPQLEVQILTV